jgi:hypothetical protein
LHLLHGLDQYDDARAGDDRVDRNVQVMGQDPVRADSDSATNAIR